MQSHNCASEGWNYTFQWRDSNGVRFLTQPVKVATSKWREFTTDCASIVAGEKGSGDVFVFAYTFREEDSEIGRAHV